jgi:hypothetical protein
MALDDDRVVNKTSLLKSHNVEQVKQHIVHDSLDRPVLVFTTYIEAANNDPCLVTEYVYRSPTSTQVRSRQERVGKWNTAWEAAFIYDPAVSYDPDADGEL